MKHYINYNSEIPTLESGYKILLNVYDINSYEKHIIYSKVWLNLIS